MERQYIAQQAADLMIAMGLHTLGNSLLNTLPDETPQEKSGYDKPQDRLEWQEGTAEPEDEPNVSNGVDLLPKKSPTRQPGESAYFN